MKRAFATNIKTREAFRYAKSLEPSLLGLGQNLRVPLNGGRIPCLECKRSV
jgi:hypothetical protein